jgi:hypothetical protein
VKVLTPTVIGKDYVKTLDEADVLRYIAFTPEQLQQHAELQVAAAQQITASTVRRVTKTTVTQFIEGFIHELRQRYEWIQINARPIFDGTRESCKSSNDFDVLYAAQRQVVRAYERLDDAADTIERKMKRIRTHLASRVTRTSDITAAAASFDMTALQAARHVQINELGELQSSGPAFDIMCAVLEERRLHFVELVAALGYRLDVNQKEIL